jgi:hypothetical protein
MRILLWTSLIGVLLISPARCVASAQIQAQFGLELVETSI